MKSVGALNFGEIEISLYITLGIDVYLPKKGTPGGRMFVHSLPLLEVNIEHIFPLSFIFNLREN